MLQRIITILNNLKLRTKLFLSFIIVVFIPVLIIGLVLTGELRKMALDNAKEQTAINMERVKQRTAEVFDVAIDTAYRLASDNRLEGVVNQQYRSTYEVVESYREYRDFDHILLQHDEIKSIRFYIDNPTMLNNWEFIVPIPSIVESEWYQKVTGNGPQTGWYYIEDERDKREYLSLVRNIHFWDYNSSGVLVINMNMSQLNAILRQESFDTMIVDTSGTIVAANHPDRIGSTLSEMQIDLEGQASGSFAMELDGQASQIEIEPIRFGSSMNELQIVSIYSIDQIVADTDRIRRVALIVIGISLVLAVVLIYGFSAVLSARLLRLSKHISKVATGNLDASLAIDGKDEIGQLSRQFNSMVSSIHELLAEVQESNRQKGMLETKQNEIQFKMMASQINPHFLFNTLESIRMKAHMKGEKEIAQVVRMLGKMTRKNLEVGERKTTVKDEMDMVRSYLEIQKFRHEDRLNYELFIDPMAELTLIPPLIIQPLVENAVIHGLETKEEGGTVTVRVERMDDGEVQVQVCDDGVGIGPERIEAIRATFESSEEQENSRIGLRNVHVRLVLTYGEASGLHIESTSGEGTRFYFHIPAGGERLV